mmetsp:Transcript_24430/g.36460  ORF Transcript_24430/g.36460 Transcript_24430/m.36460 type:complete len:91 (-) Transcript_24430:200-472(-)
MAIQLSVPSAQSRRMMELVLTHCIDTECACGTIIDRAIGKCDEVGVDSFPSEEYFVCRYKEEIFFLRPYPNLVEITFLTPLSYQTYGTKE